MKRKKGTRTKTGCQSKQMNEVYEESSLTPLRVAQLSGYRDWSSQPCMFKHYPNFLYRYRY
ncbi:MAG: hypothetical protein WBK95_01395 [Sulfurimonas sp.]